VPRAPLLAHPQAAQIATYLGNPALQAEISKHGTNLWRNFSSEVAYIAKQPNTHGVFNEFHPDAALTDRVWRTSHDLFPGWNFNKPGSNRCWACSSAHGLGQEWDGTPKNALCTKVTGMRQA
jgi:hypothetical protein